MKDVRHQFSVSHVITPQLIGHNLSGCTVIIFQPPLEETLNRGAIAAPLKKNTNYLAILIYYAPQIVLNAIYLDENFVEIKHITEAFVFFPESPCKFRPKFITPLSYLLVTDNYVPLGENIFDEWYGTPAMT
jgi:hypothetical protein